MLQSSFCFNYFSVGISRLCSVIYFLFNKIFDKKQFKSITKMDLFNDRQLLDYDTYEDYLDSLIHDEDMFYLRNKDIARMVAALGFKSLTDVLTKKQFHHKKEVIREVLYPSQKPHILFSAHCHSDEPLLQELATRERPNRVGMMSTIISLTHRQSNGVEISGFIDYEESLRKTILEFEEDSTDWCAIFKETERIKPKTNDLGYYNWSTGFSILNETKNFKAIADPIQGLIFESKHDRYLISTDPSGVPAKLLINQSNISIQAMDIFDDRKLLDYETYEDYLDSFVQTDDIFYLRNRDFVRINAALGHRSSSEILSRSAFYSRQKIVREELFPSRQHHILFSHMYKLNDELLLQLAQRERPNRVGMMMTIIFIRHRLPNGVEISGYIDFEDSLRKSIFFDEAPIDWYSVFKHKKRLLPTKQDLGYFNWGTGYSCLTNTKNYKAISDPIIGLIFESRIDRRQILMNPSAQCSRGTTRTHVQSDNYGHIILFDHVVRNKK
ncbi:Cilia- and flagella-associated protein [Pseudolycoriella hygida]|uniref:Cilia- and flagella-associated protein 299 n=1 Tax=Pseudolycoriella hygida TaxID=35572 RepID=A0A9Q0S7F0_9DIPT|nr:Cilia- and flagella-associated protein [Pseudolycoriella hygida]